VVSCYQLLLLDKNIISMVGSKLKVISNNNLLSKFCCKIFLDVTLSCSFVFFFRWERWFFFPLSSFLFLFVFVFVFLFSLCIRGEVQLICHKEKNCPISHLFKLKIQERNLCICLSTKKLGPSLIACPGLPTRPQIFHSQM